MSRGANAPVEVRLDELERMVGRARLQSRVSTVLLVLVLAGPAVAQAIDALPHVFSNGDVLTAEHLNENFGHVFDELVTVDSRVSALESGSASMDAALDSVGGQLATVDGEVGALDDDLNALAGRVSDLEAPIVEADAIQLAAPFFWFGDSNPNGAVQVTTHRANCDASRRGRLAVIEHRNISTTANTGDSLCFCGRYVHTATSTEEYFWTCFYDPNGD